MKAPDFWRVQVLGATPSTQDLVHNLAKTGEPEGLVIQALQQTKGRGRHGNAWTSPMGNLYMSVLLRPTCRADKVGQMAFVSALALSDAIDEVMAPDHDKTLKWPNDVLIDGKKISGILLENALDVFGRIDYLIIGFGINMFAPPETGMSLDQIKTDRIAINTFRDLFLGHLKTRYDEWQDKGFAEIRKTWLNQAHGLDAPMRIRLPEVTYEGVFRGIDENGTLLADVDGQRRTFTAGEVHFGTKD